MSTSPFLGLVNFGIVSHPGDDAPWQEPLSGEAVAGTMAADLTGAILIKYTIYKSWVELSPKENKEVNARQGSDLSYNNKSS